MNNRIKSKRNSKSKPYPNDLRSTSLKILLIGLSGEHTPQTIELFFKKTFNSILRVKMKKRNKKSNKVEGIGTMILGDPLERDQILKKGQFFLKGRKFHAKPFLKGRELKEFQNNVKRRRIFVNFIPRNTSNEKLKRTFLIFGEIEDAFVITDIKRDNKSLGYGFVMFYQVSSAEKAIQQGSINLEGSTIKICPYQKEGHKNNQYQASTPGKRSLKGLSPITANIQAKPEFNFNQSDNFQLDNLPNRSPIENDDSSPQPNSKSKGNSSPQSQLLYSEEIRERYKEIRAVSQQIGYRHKLNYKNLQMNPQSPHPTMKMDHYYRNNHHLEYNSFQNYRNSQIPQLSYQNCQNLSQYSQYYRHPHYRLTNDLNQ